MGTKATKFLVKVFEFLGFACWYPLGLVILRFLMGESLFGINVFGCLVLALFGFVVQFLIWINLLKLKTKDEINKGVKYKIIGVGNDYF